jgi:ribosome-binding factor A
MRQFSRSNRLEEQILRDISMIFENEMRDQLPAFITITQVRLSGDLRHATIFYSVLGDETKRNTTSEFLEAEKKHIRHLVAKRLRIRQIPEFMFKYDVSIEEGIRLEQLFNEIKDKNQK